MAERLIAAELRRMADDLDAGKVDVGGIEYASLRNKRTGRRFGRIKVVLEWDGQRFSACGFAFNRIARVVAK